ncbi:TonB-dependent receptor [Pseudopedobacter beijingensis]|uniref:TonB-dependent receptor n=1 Tax=Pseudopedobacter beijingensis TaxID=1207056 RepID=A0ABW4I653_9SPHI
MTEIFKNLIPFHQECIKKVTLVMKITALFLFISCLHLSAKSLSQTVNLQAKNKSLTEVLSVIKKQTGFLVIYNNRYVKDVGNVSVTAKNMPLESFLNEVLKNTGLTYVINQKSILIKKVAENKKAQNTDKSIEIFNQQKTITGKVTDEKGEPLPGVSVKVKNTQTNTVSDVNGNYKINVLNRNSVLVFNYLGFAMQEKAIGDNNVLNISLVQEASKLNEVVVIGYGEVKRGDLTGSVSEVKVEDIRKAPVATYEQALAGRIAGVQVSSGEDQPGNTMDVVIRGGNSLTQSNAPLYVIDGFPMEDANAAAINPSDIKSITVLKDASSTAIYGARGANGVIVIETNSGSDSRTRITYNNFVGFQEVTKRMQLMNAYEFVKYQNEFDPQYANRAFFANGKTLDDYRNEPVIDWQGLLFRRGHVQNHNISVSGGNRITDFTVSGSTLRNDGSVINTGFKRNTGRAYLKHNISPKLNFNITVSYTEDESFGDQASTASTSTQSYASYLMYRVWGFRPVATKGMEHLVDGLMDEDANDTRVNPYIDYSNTLRVNKNQTVFANTNISYKITKELELRIRGGVNNRTLEESSFYNSATARGSTLVPGNTKGVNGGVIYRKWRSWLNENTLTYSKKIANNNLTALVGFTMQENSQSRYGMTAEQVPNESLGLSGLDQGIPGAVSAYTGKNVLMSYLGRLNYNIKSKYLFTATYRTDGSSKFREGNKWAGFPSAAFAWKLRNERFMRNLYFINDAKLRTSYGVTGNNRIGDYQRFSEMNMPFSAYYSFNNSTPSPGTRIYSYGNEDLKWESTKQLDVGLDLALFKNKVSFTADFYRKVTEDLLLMANVPNSSGFTSIYKNVGDLSNTGIEFSLGLNLLKKKDFSWDTDFNISFNKNKILSLAEDQSRILTPINWGNYSSVNLYLAQVGEPSAQFYGLIWDGVYGYDDFNIVGGDYVLKDEVSTNGMARSVIQPGDIKYVDVNGDGIINNYDNVVIGRTLPVHFGGLNNNFSYKNLSLNVFFQWSYGNDIMNANRMYFEGNVDARSALNQYASYADRWSPDNTGSNLFRTKGQGPAGFYSSRTVEDGSYLRLKTVNLSYSLPQKLTKKISSDNITVFVSAQNLYTWTNYSGMDPEVSVRNSALTPGFDYSAYPRGRTYTMGLKATF